MCVCNYMCIRSELEQLGLVILAAFVILVSGGGTGMWVYSPGTCATEAPKGTQQHLLFTLLICKLLKKIN